MRFLMIYPNNTGNSRVPPGIVYLLTILKNHGHDVRLFDMTFYGVDLDYHHVHMRAANLNFREVSLEPYGVTYQNATMADVEKDLRSSIASFQPEVIGVSIVEDTSAVGLQLAQVARDAAPDAVIVMGGIYCMTDPESVIAHPAVDILSIGEAETSLPALLESLEVGGDPSDVLGFWVKKVDGTVTRRPVAPPVALDDLPYPDLSFVDERHFYAPMAGHVYRMVYAASQRGCPRRCYYCNNQVFLDTYSCFKKQYLRRMSVPRFIDNLVYLKTQYDVRFFHIVDDDFLFRPLKDIRQFSELYVEKVQLPFWIQAEGKNVTDEKVALVRDAGCMAAGIGIETGNEHIRKNVFHRTTPPEATLRAFEIMHKHGIRTSGNVIIGVPHEGRKEIFDTIEFVRQCQPRALNVNIYAPYRGTKLREYCVENGWLNKDFVHNGRVPWRPVLNMPQISKTEIENLCRTFALYATLPKECWPVIERCEKGYPPSPDTEAELRKMYWEIVTERGIDVSLPEHVSEKSRLRPHTAPPVSQKPSSPEQQQGRAIPA